MQRINSLLIVFLSLMSFLLPLTAAAEASESAHYYHQAQDAYLQGHFERAAELLERAFAHDQNLIHKYNQILVYQSLGDYDAARRIIALYGEFLRADGRFDDIDDIRIKLDEALHSRHARQAAERHDLPATITSPQKNNASAWALLGSGGTLLLTGAFLSSGFLISDTIDRLENSRISSGYEQIYANTSDLDRSRDIRTLRIHQTTSTLLLAGGIVLASTGATLLFLDNKSAPVDNHSPQRRASLLRVQPLINTAITGASISGRF